MMKKRNVILIVIMTIIFTSIAFSSSIYQEVKVTLSTKLNIKVNGQNFVAKDTDGTILRPLTYKGRTYLPVRAIGEALNVPVDYDLDNNTVLLGVGAKNPINLEITTQAYRAMWKNDYKYNTPILINDLNDWKQFLEVHPTQSSNEDVLQENYNGEFFEKRSIYVYMKSETSGSVELSAKRAELNDGKLKLFMERIAPEIGTSDMATRVCLFGIDKNDLKDVKMVEGIILE